MLISISSTVPNTLLIMHLILEISKRFIISKINGYRITRNSSFASENIKSLLEFMITNFSRCWVGNK
jgi:hypothetical protein